MPLLKRRPFLLLDPPKDLNPYEKVFQVRFTKEIFRDYHKYLNRVNLYRERVWTCKVSGKSNLTYEEALVSEHHAAEKAQKLPRELIEPVLHMIQYSTLSLTDLVNKIYGTLQEEFFERLELNGRKDGSVSACKILKVIIGSGNTKTYEVGWIGQDNAVTSTSVVQADDLLIRKKARAGRSMLKIFIRESTSQNSPWIIHANLAKKYGITTEPPKDLLNGQGLPKLRGLENGTTTDGRKKLKKGEPIDDLLLKPTADDPNLSKKHPLSTDFRVPVDYVGDLLMVWDFCMSYGRILCLSPFSLSDMENAICHKESNLALLVEIHAALFNLLIKDRGGYFTFLQNKRRKSKVTLVTWAEYLCDFMEMVSKEEFSSSLSTVRRGHYGLLHTAVKLKILRELVDEAITTSAVRRNIDEKIDHQQAIAASKRELARNIKEGEKLTMEGVAEKETSQTDAAQNVNGSVNGQVVEKEGKEKKNKYANNKMGEGRHLGTELDKQSIQTDSLGKDRLYNRYWFFRHDGRLFVESADSKEWGYYSTKEELDALIGSLNVKGIRERALKRQLDKFYNTISNALEKRTKDVTQKMLLEEVTLRRSSRVQAQPKDNPSMSFLKYVNKWKEN
uniref:DDT domain-containing protein n=1 Tax=Oryza brachyantha TaxID=4533 RepID=J3LY46_ORYBR